MDLTTAPHGSAALLRGRRGAVASLLNTDALPVSGLWAHSVLGSHWQPMAQFGPQIGAAPPVWHRPGCNLNDCSGLHGWLAVGASLRRSVPSMH